MHGRFDAFQDHSVPELTLELRGEAEDRSTQGVFGASLMDELDCDAHCGNYVYAGMRYELPISGWIEAGVGLVVGSYHSGGIELGSALVMRPGVDVGVTLAPSVRAGAYLHHYTSTAWGEDDPGAESIGLQLQWSF